MKSITAYIRLSNEENTIVPCLCSIENIFDEILIIYSQVDDNSIRFIRDYIAQKNITNIKIIQYPHNVLPPHSIEYKNNNYNTENSLASYYNFGLKYINTDLFMKIDADQIYFNDLLKREVEKCKNYDEPIYVGFMGHNCIVSNQHVYLHKNQPFNGGADHFIIPTMYANFIQTKQWERLELLKSIDFYTLKDAYWFHLKKGHRYNGVFVSGDKYKKETLSQFDCVLSSKYEKYVKPLLKKNNSPYKEFSY